jgi:hypothetical protein
LDKTTEEDENRPEYHQQVDPQGYKVPLRVPTLYLAFDNDRWDDQFGDFGTLPDPFQIVVSEPQPRRSRGRWWLSSPAPKAKTPQDVDSST